jgi:hypothetical protein
MLHCHEDFLQTGAARAICGILPFDVIGCTVIGSAVPGAAGPYLLSLTVLTSDDVVFAAGASEPIEDSPDGPMEKLYGRILASLPEPPSFCILCDPFLQACTSERLLRKLNALAGNVPIFGLRAFDSSQDHAASCTIHNGASLHDSAALIAMSGDVDPVFLLENRVEGRVFNQHAVITDAEENLLKKVNGIPAIEYFASLGLVKNGVILGRESLIFLVHTRDGPPVCRVYLDTTPEGYIVCAGDMPVRAELQLEIIDPESVISSARKLVNDALRLAPGKSMLLASCVIRSWALGMNELLEMETVAECAGRNAPWHFVYGGGEICPSRDATGRWINRFHNATLVICLL